MKIEGLKETGSTNETIRRYIPARENVALYADRQTGGKGTKGRSFLSEEGGIYLSFLTFYENFPASRAFEVMAHAAVAVCRTVEPYGVLPQIKWANDVLAAGRKLCGILVENSCKGGLLDYSIVGIGLNAENSLRGLEGIAVSLKEIAQVPFTVDGVRRELIENYGRESAFSDYVRYHTYLGKRIRVIEGERSFEAIARGILPDGRLEIEEGGKVRALSGAEIRLDPRSLT